MLEVAFEGFSGKYGLSPKLEERYARRIRAAKGKEGKSTRINDRIFDMMKNGCSEYAQELFAGMWAVDFELALHSLQKLSRPSGPKSVIVKLRSGGTGHATAMTRLRKMAAESILSGGLTSPEAHSALAPILDHYKVLDPIFISHSRVFHSFLPRLLGSEHMTKALRSYLLESMKASECIECRHELGRVVDMPAARPVSDSDECA